MFDVEESDDTCYFMAGTRIYECQNKKVKELCETGFGLHRSKLYFIAKDAKSDDYHILNRHTKELKTEKFDAHPQSIYRTKDTTFMITKEKKLISLQNGSQLNSVDIAYDTEARIVFASEEELFIVVACKNSMDYLETMLCIYDLRLNLLSKNLFVQKETDHFSLREFKMCKSDDESQLYVILTYSGGTRPIILKKAGTTKYIQPQLKSPSLPGISTFSEIMVNKNSLLFGTGRKIYSVKLTEKEQTYAKEDAIKNVKESQLIITEMYKDQLSRLKRAEIQAKDFGFDVLLSRVVSNPTNKDQLYISKNSKDNKTNILRFNFQTETSVEVVKEVEKLEDQSYLVDLAVNHENLINGIDSNGYYYTEMAGDKMVITDLMTYGRVNTFNYTKSRQIAINESRTKAYLVADDGDSVLEVDLLDHKKHKGLHGNLFGTLEVKMLGDTSMYGIKKLVNKAGKAEYVLYHYDVKNEALLDQANLLLPTNYHVEAIRMVNKKHILVVANQRDDASAKTGKSANMIFGLYTTDLQRVFLSSDVPIGNKFGESNIVEVLTTYQDLPVIVVSKEATLYLLAIESESKLKQIDVINFSQSEGPGSKLESPQVRSSRHVSWASTSTS
jgi:hypothetical protein